MGMLDKAIAKVRKQAGLPPVPKDVSPEQRQFFQAIRENLAVRMGQEGDPLEKAVTFKDMLNANMASWAPGRSGGPSITPPPVDDDLDYSSPPAPTNVVANGGFGIVYLTWDNPNLNYIYYAEVWRSPVDALDLQSGDMKMIGSARSPQYVDNLGGDRSLYYYWVRYVRVVGATLVYGPFNATAGTAGQTGLDPDYVIEVLQGQLTESELANELLTPIQSIPTIQDTLDDYGIRIPNLETTVGNHAVQIPSMQGLLDDYGPRINAAEGTIVDHENDITSLQASLSIAQGDIIANADAYSSLDTRVTANEVEISVQAGQITSLQASLNDLAIPAFDANYAYAIGELFRYDNVVYEVINTQSQPNATPPNATYYTPRPDYETIADTVSANSAAVSALDTRVTAAENEITAQATDITLLQSDMATAQGDITANAAATSSLDTRVTTAESNITSLSGEITVLQNGLATTNGNVTTNADAISSLQTEVSNIDGVVTSQSTDITQLQNALAAAELDISANAGAITSLEARVTTAEGEISSQSTQLTSLSNGLATAGDDITANSQALSLLDSRVGTAEDTISTHTSQITQLQADVESLDVGGNAAALQALDVRVTANEQDITVIASDITTLQAGIDGNMAALQTKAEVSAVQSLEDDIAVLSAQYTIKLDVNGRVAGIGLANVNGVSEFVVASDAVYFIDPGQSSQVFDPGRNYTSMTELRDSQLVFGYAEVEGHKRFVINVPAYIPEGYITTAMVKNATINKAQIVDLSVDGAEINIANIWEIAGIGGIIQSIPFASGTTGWRILQDGNAEFNNVTVRGHVEANTGRIRDNVIIGNGSKSAAQLLADTQALGDAADLVTAWTKPGTTYIDGNQLWTGDAYVDTLQIKGQAVTFPRGAYTSSQTNAIGSTWTTVQSLTLSGATGAPLIIDFCAAAFAIGNAAMDIRLLVAGSQRFYGDDVLPRYAKAFDGFGGLQYESRGLPTLTYYYASPPSGTVSVVVQMRFSGGNGFVSSRSLSVMEAKR